MVFYGNKKCVCVCVCVFKFGKHCLCDVYVGYSRIVCNDNHSKHICSIKVKKSYRVARCKLMFSCQNTIRWLSLTLGALFWMVDRE
jgi:hypothetical protein